MSTAMANTRALSDDYRNRTPGSAKLAEAAKRFFPSGITHDARYQDPYGIYVQKAQGAYKWDVDGNRYIDYFGGHGSLLLGHAHPTISAAICAAVEMGTHFGANSPLEIEWAQAIRALVPSAELIRFLSSGTEASMMALRLARAFTGRRKIIRFRGHFHGWNDHMAFGYATHLDGSPSIGVVPGVAEDIVLVDAGDIAAVEAALDAHRGDVAGVILEPTGSTFGLSPIPADYVRALRALTEDRNVVLIFDEVVTGFRVAPGGYQSVIGVTPDLTCFAKAVAGGLPGAVVCGRRDVMGLLDFESSRIRGREKLGHQGTFNANPVSAAAGIAVLGLIADGSACAQANARAATLRRRLNETLEEQGYTWAVYGTFSEFHVFMNPGEHSVVPTTFNPGDISDVELRTPVPQMVRDFRLAMLCEGIDLNSRGGGLLSAAHSDEDIESTADAFGRALRRLKQDRA